MKQFNFLSKLSLNERGKVVTRLKPHFTPIHPSWCFVSVLCLLLTFGAGNAWAATFTKITSLTDLTTGNYVIVGQKGASSYGRLIYGTPDGSGRLSYTEHYTSLPASITTTTAGEIWKLTVSGTGTTRTVTIYNAGQKMYLNSTTGKLAVKASSANWTSKYSSSFSMYYGSTYYLGVNKNTGSDYWRDYGSSTLYNSSGYVLTLYKEVNCTTSPTVEDGSNSDVTHNSATVSCESGISSLGSAGCVISSYGFVIGSSANPAIGGSGVTKHEVGTTYTTAGTSFSKDLTGLSAETTYYVRPYATNGNGTAYGTQTSFTTLELPKYKVTYNAGTGTCGTSSWTQTSYGESTTLPSASPSAGCTGGWSFAGWCTSSAGDADENSTSPGTILTGSYTPTGDVTLYAVYKRTASGGGSVWAETDIADLTSSDIFVLATPGGYAVSNNNGTSSAPSAISITVSDGKITSTVEDNMKWNISGDGDDGYVFYPNGTTDTWLYCTTTASSGSNNNIRVGTGARKYWVPDNEGDYVTNDTYTDRWLCNYNNSDFRGYVGASVTSDIVSKCYKYTTSGTTYYMTSLVCCTALGSINGSVSRTVPGTATLSWDAVTGAEKYQVKVPGSSSHNDWTDATSGVEVSGLACGTSYTAYFRAIDTDNSHCSIGPESTASIPASSWTVTSSGVTNATASPAIPATTCNGFSTTITAATGYALPADITVTNATKSWNSSTGALSISSVTGDVTITITPTCVSPVIGTDPASATYQEGASPAALSVAATLASGTLTYQWQKSTDGGDNWSNESGTGYNTATYAAANISTALAANGVQYRCIVGNSEGGCTVTSAVATITITAAANFVNGATVFIQAESSSAWDASACVKAWFNNNGADGAAQTTYWLFNATGDDSGKKLYAAVVPADGNLNQVTLQRFAEGCGSFWNNNGTVTKASDGGSNILCTNGSGTSNVSWKATALTMNLMSSVAWNTPVATLTDQGAGVWRGTYEYTPSGTSTDYVIKTNYNGNIGNTDQNYNYTLGDLHVGSTYNVTATLDVTDHSFEVGKTFVKGEVSFDLQGHGDAIAKLTNVTAGSKISAPSAPTADYFTFGGWFKEPACTNEWNFATDEVSETMTLYAKWTAIPVTALELNYSSLKRYVGENSVTLNVTSVTPNTADPSVTWSSSNTGVAEVTSAGVVTFASAGTATITATSTISGSVTATCAVEVRSISGPTMQDEDGTTIDAGDGKPSVSWTLETRTLTASEGTSNYKFKRWIVTNATASDATNATTTLGDPTDNVTVIAEFYKPISVTWKVGTGAASGGTREVKYGTKVSELPSTPDVAAVASCGDANTFMGWTALGKLEGTGNAAPADLFSTVGGATALTSNTTYRAVFANHTEGEEEEDQTPYTHTIESKTWSDKGAQTLNGKSWTLDHSATTDDTNYGYDGTKGQQVGKAADPVSTMSLSTSAFSGKIKAVKITTSGANGIEATVGVSVGNTNFTSGGNTTVALTTTSTEYTFTGSATGEITISWAQTSSKALYFKAIEVDYATVTPTVSNTNYITGCCTPLGAIGGAVEYTNPTTAVLTWNKMSNVDATTPYTITYRTGEAAYGSSNVGAVDLSGAKATCTITDLACNTPYDFKIAVTAAEDYCDKDSVMTETSPKYSITKGSATGGTFTTKISTDDVTESCNGATIAIAATPNAGYTFTSWTITNDDNSGADVTSTLLGGSSTTASTSFTMPSYRVTVTPTFSCVAVNHVTITGSWDYFGGETISLTATAYATAGTESPIPAADITGYQWQKWYNEQWNDVSDGGNISGTSTNNLVITNSTGSNSGSYRCAVTTGATCSASNSDGLEVKVFTLECYTGGQTTYDFTRDGENQRGSVEVTLAANTAYEFKIHADNVYYGNSGTVNEDVTDWECTEGYSNLTVNSGLGGTFTFTMDYSSSGSSSIEGIPELSITYPRKTLYLTPGVWNTGGEKFAFYYFRDNGSSAWTDFITANDCGSSAEIPQWNGVKINAVRLDENCSSPNWTDKWNQTGNITVSSNDNVVITGWGPENGDSPYSYGTYTIPTYSISYATGTTAYTGGNVISGEKASETKTCGEDFTLPSSAVFSTTGYTQTGWAISDGGSQAYAFGGTYSTNAAQAFYPAWTANNHTLSWSANGGDELTGAYTSGTVAYGTTIVAPDTPTKTGYTFTGWSPAVPSTMPDDDLTCTATWSATSYTITYNNLNGASNSNPANYTIESSAITLVAPGTREGYTFAGWYTNEDLADGHEASTPAIAAGSTGNKTFWAKWTKIHTVTWHVGNGTWSVGQHNVDADNTQVLDGSQIATADMPDDPADNTLSSCASKFMGWSKKNYGSTSGKDDSDYDDLFKKADGSPTITQDTTFFAVFAEQTNSNGYKYVGDAVATLTDGEKYIFVDSKTAGSAHALKATDLSENSSAGKKGTSVGVSITSNSEGILVTSENSALEFEYVSTGTKLKYVDGVTTKYLFINGNGVGYKTNDSRSSYGTHQLYGWTNGYANRYVYYDGTNGNFTISESAQNMYAYIKQTPVYGNYRTQCDPNIIKVTYDANDGTTSCEDESHDKRNDYTVCATEPTRDYYEFAGWLCSADSKIYDAGATIDDEVITADFSLTAQWTPVSYSITYNYNGGSAQVDPAPATSYTVESSDITLQTPTYGHNRFEGWYENADLSTGGVKTTIAAGSHENKTYYAKWATRHHIEFFKEGTSIGEMWRADDENMEDAVAGQGSVPSDPSAPTTCSSKEFAGWSEDEIDDETNTRPSDLMRPAAGTVDEDKEYHAVWAIATNKSGTLTYGWEDADATTGWTNIIARTSDLGSNASPRGSYSAHASASAADTQTEVVMIQTVDMIQITALSFYATKEANNTAAASWVLQQSYDGSSWEDIDFWNASSVTRGTWTQYSLTAAKIEELTSSAYIRIILSTASTSKRDIDDLSISYDGTTYTAYSTSCCATKVTLSQNNPEHGTIVFGKESVGTCGDKEVSLTITPAAGYQLHSYEVATGSGKVSATADPAISLDNNSNAAQNITLTFASGANGAYDVTASFTEMTVTSWTWTMHDGGGAIPDPLNLYIGQSARVDVEYNPSSVLSTHKNYSRSKDDTYINWPGGAQPSAYCTFVGKASTGENTTTITLTHSDAALEQLIYVKVLPLPLTHFVDLVHGKAFANVAATIEDNALSATKTTPTSDDWTTPNANSCEEQHLHLVGWIREDWPALVAYLAGTGDAPLTSAIVGAGNDGEGHAYFLAPGASINVQIFNGKTFYAVWAKME